MLIVTMTEGLLYEKNRNRWARLFRCFSLDNAYACDPRIARFKEEEKQKKLAEKQARKDAAMAKAKEEERVSIGSMKRYMLWNIWTGAMLSKIYFFVNSIAQN